MRNFARALAVALTLACGSEGLKLTPYYDPGGILTVCRGHTGPDIIKGRKYSIPECDKLITDDMIEAIEIVDRCVPGLPDEVVAAFGDAVFNLGPKIVCDTEHSTAARLLASGQIAPACRQLPRWNKTRIAGMLVELPGLTKRRNLEMAVCLGYEP